MISKYRNQIKISIAVVLSALLPAWSSLSASAQQPAAKNTRKAAPFATAAEEKFTPEQKAALAARRRKWMLAQRSESGGSGESAWHLMKKPYDLPNLPAYSGTGAEFVAGLVYPNKPGGAALSMTYRAKEAPDVVLGWYDDALANYHWKVVKGKDSNTLEGTNGNNGVAVVVKPAVAPGGFKTELKISYKLARK